MGAWTVFAGVALLVGAFAGYVALSTWRHERARRGRGTTTPGVVVGSRLLSTTASASHYYPTVRFTDAGGRAREFVDSVGTGLPPRDGTTVTVWYDPARPDERPAVLGSGRRLVLPLVFAVVGVAGIGTAVGLVVAAVLGHLQ